MRYYKRLYNLYLYPAISRKPPQCSAVNGVSIPTEPCWIEVIICTVESPLKDKRTKLDMGCQAIFVCDVFIISYQYIYLLEAQLLSR